MASFGVCCRALTAAILQVRSFVRTAMLTSHILSRSLAACAGLQDQLQRVEKDRQDLLEICQGRLAGIQGA